MRRTVDGLHAIVLPALLMLIQQPEPAFSRTTDAVQRAVDVIPRAESYPDDRVLTTSDVADSETMWIAAARRSITLREYHASENAVGLQAPSRRHAIRTYFEPTGIRVVDRVTEGSSQLLVLQLEQVGRVNFLTPVPPGKVVSEGARVEIRRESLTEWYVNSPDGLEQGFTLSERTEGEGPMVLDLSLKGAEASWNGTSVQIVTAAGRQFEYGQLRAVDARGTSLPVELSVPSDSRIQLRVDDTNAVYPVVIDPVLTAVAGTRLESGQRGALMGFSVAGAGDVNGDGYADVIVGAMRYDAGESNEGAAFIFHGSADGIADANPAAANAWLEGDQAEAEMGKYVAGAGDVNGDGYDDVIVGAWHYDAGEADEGAAFIFHGSADGIANGNPATANTRIMGDQPYADFGVIVDGAGDVNGDGYADVIVGAWHYDAGETDEGAAFIFHGGAEGIADATPATANTRLTGQQANAQMGISVAGAGDVNADGFADVIVGAFNFDAGETDEGCAFVFLGSASGIADARATMANARLESNQKDAWMGVSVGGAGDVNGDGFADVIVGARQYDAGEIDEGVAFVFHGSPTGIANGNPATARTRIEGDQADAWMGYSVDGAGDINGDGFDDVIVGAGRYDTGSTLLGLARRVITGESDEGAAFLFLGSASGIADANTDSAHAILGGNQAAAHAGTSVSAAGDVNGDGFGDVIVGAYFSDCGQKNEGAAFVYMGGDSGSVAGSQREGCGPGVPDFPIKKIAAALVFFVAVAGFMLFRWRRRKAGKPAA